MGGSHRICRKTGLDDPQVRFRACRGVAVCPRRGRMRVRSCFAQLPSRSRLVIPRGAIPPQARPPHPEAASRAVGPHRSGSRCGAHTGSPRDRDHLVRGTPRRHVHDAGPPPTGHARRRARCVSRRPWPPRAPWSWPRRPLTTPAIRPLMAARHGSDAPATPAQSAPSSGPTRWPTDGRTNGGRAEVAPVGEPATATTEPTQEAGTVDTSHASQEPAPASPTKSTSHGHDREEEAGVEVRVDRGRHHHDEARIHPEACARSGAGADAHVDDQPDADADAHRRTERRPDGPPDRHLHDLARRSAGADGARGGPGDLPAASVGLMHVAPTCS